MKKKYSFLKTFFALIVFTATFFTTASSQTSCVDGNFNLELTFDANPEEINWIIMDKNNTIAAYGNTYNSQAPFSTLNIPINNLPNGDYLFLIIDIEGDGNTSYKLIDNGNTIVSGNSFFGFSQSVQFCNGSSQGNTLDTIPPSAPSNLTATNITTNSVDLSWDAATDNVGAFKYGLFLNGNFIGDFQYLALTLTNVNSGLLPNTTYTFEVRAADFTGNISATAASVTFTTLPNITATTIHEGFFENGWDNWIDGGANARRISNVNAFEGSRSVRLRNGTSSSQITLENLSLDTYSAVELSFYFKSRGMDTSDSFVIEFFDGTTWTNASTVSRSTDFSNNQFYNVIVTLNSIDYTLSSSSKIRIRNQGNHNNDRIFVDKTKVIGYTGTTSSSSTSITIANNNKLLINDDIKLEELNDEQELSELQINVYPNPSKNHFYLDSNAEIVKVSVFNSEGIQVKQFQNNAKKYDVEDLKNGLYFIKVQTKNDIKILRLIKK